MSSNGMLNQTIVIIAQAASGGNLLTLLCAIALNNEIGVTVNAGQEREKLCKEWSQRG